MTTVKDGNAEKRQRLKFKADLHSVSLHKIKMAQYTFLLRERNRKMKKNLMTVLGIVLIIASVFGMIAAGFGINDISDVLRYNKLKKAEVKDAISFLEKNIAALENEQLEATEKDDSEETPSQETPSATPTARQNPVQVDWNAVDDYDSAVAAYSNLQQQMEYADGQLVSATMRLNEAEEQLAACESYLGEVKPTYDVVYPLYEYYLDLQATYEQALDEGGFKAAGLAAAVMAAKSAYEAKLDGKSISSIIADYQNAQAAYDSALAERNAASANLKDLQAMYDEAAAALAEAQSRMDNAAYNRDQAAQYNTWETNNANSGLQSEAPSKSQTVGSDELADILSGLEDISDTETIVRTGIDALLGIEGIAAHVTSSSDYESVINAANIYVDENSLNLERELDMRQNMCTFLRFLGIGCLLAGIACIIADHKRTVTSLRVIFIICGIAFVASAGVTTYGLIKGFDECAYTLADGSADGSLQMLATFILLGVSFLSAVASGICFMSCPNEGAEQAPKSDSEDDEEEEYVEVVRFTKEEINAQVIAALTGRSISYIDDDNGDEEDVEPEPEDELDEIVKRRLKYEQALREYEEAITRRFSDK